MLVKASRFTLPLVALALIGWAGPGRTPRTVPGECADVYGGQVCTWAVIDGDAVLEVGATLPMATIENSPTEVEMAWPPVPVADIPFPKEAVAATGVRHLWVNWEPHGHPPGPYLHPHYDFHFYTIPTEAVDAIDCSDLSKPTALPTGYALPDVEIPDIGMLVGLCVPTMGMHALLQSELDEAVPFTGSMVVGYYAGAPIFYEPMITRELLMKRKSFDVAMPTMAATEGVHYPTHARFDYVESDDAYRIVFSGF